MSNDDSITDAPEVTNAPPALAPPAPPAPTPAPRRWWPFALAGVLLLAALIVGALVVRNSTVSNSHYDAAVEARNSATDDLATARSELRQAENALAEQQAETDELQSELEELRSASDNMTTDLAAAQERVAKARLVARVIGYFSVNWLNTDAQAIVTDGLDPALPDSILAALGEDATWLDWVDLRNSFAEQDNAIAALDDPELTEIYNAFLAAEVGSRAEAIAYNELIFRMNQLLVETLAAE